MIRIRYELQALGWPIVGVLLLGTCTSVFFVLGAVSELFKARDLMMVMGATSGLMLALLPSKLTDRAFEITRQAAEPDGSRDALLVGASLLMLLLVFVLCVFALRLPIAVLGWLPPRVLWFATVGTGVLFATRSTPLAVGAVALVFVLPYCPLPKEINPMLIQEPRWQLHALTASLGFLVPWCHTAWQPTVAHKFIWGALLGVFSLLPLIA